VGIGPQGTDQKLCGDRPRVQVNGCGAMSTVTASSRRYLRTMTRPLNDWRSARAAWQAWRGRCVVKLKKSGAAD